MSADLRKTQGGAQGRAENVFHWYILLRDNEI